MKDDELEPLVDQPAEVDSRPVIKESDLIARMSENMRIRLQKAAWAEQEYHAQQQILWILIERLGGSVTIGLESLVTKRQGVMFTHRDEDTGALTISLAPKTDLSA